MDLKALYLRKKFWINDFFHGGKMWSAFKEINYINNNIVEGEKIRQSHLQDILNFAKENVPFYKNIKGCSLADFPVINKQMILADRDAFLTPEELIPGQKGKLHIQTTSGSSGIPFALPQDTNCRIRRIALIKYGNELVGFHSFERMMHLRSFEHYWKDKKGGMVFNKDLNIVYANNANLNDEMVANICHVINEHKIKLIRGYMTTLDIITRYAIANGIDFPLHPVFISVGEPLNEALRLRVSQQLSCIIISQYGNEENGIFGQTTPNGKGTTMQLNLANCYMEILKFDSDEPVADGELGRIVVTDLTNYAMPMIRYDIGDVAMVGEKKSGIMVSIDNLGGRKTDLIIRTDGTQVDFFNSVSPDLYLNEGISQYQFIQKGEKEYLLKLNLKDESLKAMTDRFAGYVKKVVGEDANCKVEYVSEIPVLSSGKRKVVINEWKNQ